MYIHQLSQALREIPGRAALSHLDVPPAAQGLKEHEQVAGALPAIFVVVPPRLSWHCRQRLAYFTDQLVKLFIKTHHRVAGIIGFGVELQDIFHMPDELGTDGGHAPRPLQPGLERVFLSPRRTVSSEMASTTWSSTSLSASSCIVQPVRSSGGVLQASATKKASCLPSSFARAPGRGRS